MPSVGTLDGLPMLISGAGAWVMFEGYWVPANWGDAAWNGRVLCIEDFLRLFPDLPPWPAEFNPDGRPLYRGLRYFEPGHYPRGTYPLGLTSG